MGGRRGVSIISHRPVTRSDLKQERSFFRGRVSTFFQLVVAKKVLVNEKLQLLLQQLSLLSDISKSQANKKTLHICPSVLSSVFASFISSFNLLRSYFMFHSIWWQFILFEI